MTQFFVLISSVLFSISAFATTNPLIRTCLNKGGEFHVIKAQDDEFAFCQFGQSLVDSLTLLVKANDNSDSCVLTAFFNQGQSPVSCNTAGGSLVNGSDVDGNQFELCFFPDDSIMEKITFEKGPQSADNQQLVQALQQGN